MERVTPKGKRDKAERLRELEDRLAHQDLAIEERCELRDLVTKLRKKAA